MLMEGNGDMPRRVSKLRAHVRGFTGLGATALYGAPGAATPHPHQTSAVVKAARTSKLTEDLRSDLIDQLRDSRFPSVWAM